MKKERTRTENETLRNHTVQIERLDAKGRLENEEQERQWNKRQRRMNETGEGNQPIEGNNEIAE